MPNPSLLNNAADLLEWPKVVLRLASFAASEPGRELCLNTPFQGDVESVRRALRLTGEARRLFDLGILPALGSVTGLSPETARLKMQATLTAEELLRLGDVLQAARTTRAILLDRWEEFPLTAEIGVRLFEDLELEREIFACIDRDGMVGDNASEELAALRRRYKEVHKQIYENMAQLATKSVYTEYLQDDYFTLRNGRYVLVVRIEKQSKVEGIVHDMSGSGRSLFIEPREITQLNNVLRNTELAIEQEVQRILQAFSNRAAKHVDELAQTAEALAEIDALFAKGRYAAFLGANEPEINSDGVMELRDLRHPLLAEKGEPVVPNTLAVEPDVSCMLITGPNTGGKTVLLKAVGLAALMARAGLHPPVGPGSNAAFFPSVFAVIGDKQSIEAGLSSFAARISALREILEAVGGRSLVLIDEIGEGTEPRQGIALSMAVLERLAAGDARTIATTHFVELAAMATKRKGFVNASMEFDRTTMAPTYRLRMGIPGRSGAFDTAERMGMDPSVIARARELYEGVSSELDEVMERMEETHRGLTAQKREAEKSAAEAKRLLDIQRDRLRDLERRQREMASEKMRQVEETYRDARERIKAVIAELQKKPSFHAAEEARKETQEIVQQAREATPPPLAPEPKARAPKTVAVEDFGDLAPGDEIFVVSMNAAGRLESLPDAKGNVRVIVGGARASIPAADIRLKTTGGGRPKAPEVRIEKPILGSESASKEDRSLDLRGQAADDALDRVREFLDLAWRSRWELVYIIHGHGTGKLKREIREYLRGAPYAMTFRPGDRHEGGDGATIVEMQFD